ncbi:MAG: hypothetical protein HOV96_17355 [Nonomuraea sp.]|nr:hypothetical protein [Nonomuraea sp.]NUP79307.1 hypothetical protein [Nonomuraea sp.]
MRLAGRSAVLSAVLLCAAVACASAHEPTLEEAARQLSLDADTLLTAAELTPSAGSIEDFSCLPGQVRRLISAEGEVAGEVAGDPGGLLDRLGAMGYAKIVDDLDLRDESRDVSVLRNPVTNLTFELTVLEGPNVRIVGKTTCFPPTGDGVTSPSQGVDSASVGDRREARTAG